jgi:hypothetical protein
MSKFKIKPGVSGKARIAYRAPGKLGMTQIILENATQEQLKDLALIGHPFVTVEKKEEKQETKKASSS